MKPVPFGERPRRAGAFLYGCLGVGLLLMAGAGAPVSSQEVVPGVRTELVRLDAVVTDSHGTPVRDLAREDFQVLEDGKPQTLVQFALAGRPSAAPPPAVPQPHADSPEAPTAPEATASGPGRSIVIVVDDLHIAAGNLEFTKQALRRFVDEMVVEDDRVALVTTGAPPLIEQLTEDRAILRQAINRLYARPAALPPARGSQMTPAQAEMILAGDRNALQLAMRTMLAEPGSLLANAPQAAVETPGGTFSTAPGGSGTISAGVERVAEKEAQRQARGVLAEALRFSSASLGAVEDVLRSVSSLPGRKLCLLASDGFLVGMRTSEERTRDLQKIIDAATRSGAVVYAIDSRGLVSAGGDASVAGTGVTPGLQSMVDRQGEQRFRQTLKTLTDETGGFLVEGSNDLAVGLRRMLADNESYYLMAYEPLNTKRDGHFRRIEVRLTHHSDFTVRTRTGYFAPEEKKRASDQGARPLPSLSVAPGLDPADARAALRAPVPSGGIPVRLTADYLDLPPTGPQVVVRAHVDLAGLRWQQAQGHHQASVDLVGGLYDADGNPVGTPFGRRAELDLSPAEYKRVTESGLQYQELVPLPPGRYQVRLIAREAKLSQLGGAAEWVEIPDLGEKKLVTSSVFLSSSASAAPSGAPEAGEALRDAHTLRRFKRGESLYFQLYVYNPALDEKGAGDVVLQAQIWSGSQAVAASKPQAATLRRKDGVPLPETNGMTLEGLAPGSYELRVVVVDRTANATASRQVDFTVE